ncbi:MAG: DNA polymerase III subunit delta' [Microgenomates group bacterium Gr01-1014_80]|nr:MAG: DNA polymerase III subunit delta' [Microgenomates group bacterium Gr01-1014_80]
MIARLLISPSLEVRVKEIEKTLSRENFSPDHPDLLYFPNDSKLGIEQARKIKGHFSLKPYSAKGRVAVMEDASALTLEAQNALLKTLEEPPEEALLLLGAKSESDLLPTVLSRCQIVILGSGTTPESNKDSGQNQNDIENLLQSSIEERFEYIEKLKDREEFLHDLVIHFRNQLHQLSHDRSTFDAKELNKFLRELLQAEEWAVQNVNIRAILEYLMLVMPDKN